MDSSVVYRIGTNEELASEFLQMDKNGTPKFGVTKIEKPIRLISEDILAVHYADVGAQGDKGAVELLYSYKKAFEFYTGTISLAVWIWMLS